jgi:PAS domain S-box-containing protein
MLKAKVANLRWYHIYYLLAAFDIITILVSLLLNHVLTEQYNESVNNNRAWATRHSEFSQLARLAAELNAPGNDVFHSNDVPGEKARLAVRVKNFNRKLKEIESEFAEQHLVNDYPQLKKDLENAKGPLISMIEEEQRVLDLVDAGKIESASQHMAIMDKQYLFATKSLIRIRLHFSDIQQALLYKQAEEVEQMRVFEQWIAGAVFIMICSVTYYGNRLALQAQANAKQRENYILKVEAARTSLENKTQELENALEELSKAQTAVVQSEKKFRAIFDHTFQLIGLMQTDGILLEANETSLNLINAKKEDVIGQYFWETPWWSHDKAMQEKLKEAIEQAAEGEFVRFEAVHLTQQGKRVEVDFSLKAVTDESGNVVLLIPEGRDISDKKEAERRVKDFYSTVSHELRTPLTAIRGSLGLIEAGLAGEITNKTRTLVEIASVESDRLIRLINDILDLRKIEAGMLELRLENVSIGSIVQRTVKNLESLADQAGVILKPDIGFAGEISCDEDRTVQILTNLISNAIKFSPRSRPVIISVAESTTPKMVRFAIKDNGPGIPEEMLSQLFVRFQQIQQPDLEVKSGTGLGLAISKALVEQHGGEIGVESILNEGTTFWFELAKAS